MATLTAQILIGRSHPNSGGINPTHYLFFSENDRPAWVLVPENIFSRGSDQTEGKVVWIPTADNPLEDAMLMIAIYVLKDEGIVELAKRSFQSLEDRVELTEDVDRALLEELYRKSRALRADHKIVLTLLNDSFIHGHLRVLEQYSMEIEVCSTIYSRLYSRWEEEWRVQGSLM